MKIRLLSSSVDQELTQFSASYVIDDSIAIDAGSLGFSTLAQQRRIRHLLLSHTHLDHIGSLPIFLDNVYVPGPDCPVVYASPDVIRCLQSDFFNDRVWPDLSRMSCDESPWVKFVELQSHRPCTIGGLRITPIELNHVVPCFGFLIEAPGATVVLVSDTGPTQEIWNTVRQCPDLKAVFLEAAFPNAMDSLADKAKHLTPQLFRAELEKLDRGVQVIAVHIKPSYYEQVTAELRQLGIPRLEIGEPNREFSF